MTKEQFKKFAKEEFGYDISFEKSDEPDTYESLFGSCKGCEHAPTTYEEYCLHTCCPNAYTNKAAGCELFKKQRAIEESYQKGLNDAWECARKINKLSWLTLEQMGFEIKDRSKNPSWDVIKEYSASEAIAKIKEYEGKQKQTEKSCRTCGYTKTSMPNYNDDRCKKCHYDGDGNTLWMPKQTEKSCERHKHDVQNIIVINFGEGDEPCRIVFDSDAESEG